MLTKELYTCFKFKSTDIDIAISFIPNQNALNLTKQDWMNAWPILHMTWAKNSKEKYSDKIDANLIHELTPVKNMPIRQVTLNPLNSSRNIAGK